MWWLDVVIVGLMIVAIVGFVSLTRASTRRLSSHTQRTAEDMYGLYESPRPHRRERRRARPN